MRRRLILVTMAVVLASCSSGKKAASPASTLPLQQETTTSALPATGVLARILSPEKGSVQGSGGRGMVVDLVFEARDAATLPAEFRLGGALPSPAPAVKPGHNPAFPGLIVTLGTTSTALGGSAANLANLFQIVSPSTQPDGSVRVSAVWTNADASFGTDVDVTLVAFTVAGTAPDTVAQTPEPTSNQAQVTFHIAGGGPPVVATGPAGSTSTTTAGPARATTTTTRPRSSTTSTRLSGSTTSTTRGTATTSTTRVGATTSTTKLLGIF